MASHGVAGHLNSVSAGSWNGLYRVPVPNWNWTSRAARDQVAVIPFGRADLEALSRSRNSAHWLLAGDGSSSEGWAPGAESDTAVRPGGPGHCTGAGAGFG